MVPFAVSVVLALVVGLLAGSLLVALAVVVVVTGGGWLALRSRQDRLCLWSLGAAPAEEGSQARARNLIEGLCLSMGLKEPRLYVAEGRGAAVAVFGGGRERGFLVVGDTLEQCCSRLEMEALLAHGLAHLRLGQGVAASRRAVSVGLVALAWPGAQSRIDNARRAAAESEADLVAVGTTRFPPALHGALSTLAASAVEVTGSRRQALACHCWCSGACGQDVGLVARIESLSDL